MDIDISYIVDIPPIITTLNTSDLNWKRGIVTFTEYDIWFPYADQVNIVPLKAIKLIDRQLPPSIMKKIHYTSREADLLVVEYQKKSTFGIGYINSIMLFAGPGSSINKIKSYLSSVLGIQVNAKYGNLNKEELRLLCLLAAGMNVVDLLIPLFDSNKALIKRSFTVLKDKNLVDDCASITQLGSEYVESIKGNGEGKLGKIARDPFGSVPQPHKAVDSFKPKKDTIKFRKRYKSSSIEGLVSIRHIGQFIQTEEINNLKKEELPFGELALNLRTMNG
ncbi:MAG: hypothetical protein U9N13_00680, partial [Euryarchaeota archaeon]|nr:hypothetical protein [Euryarchaeota archaeon]